jgi:hypothetical protein
MNIINKVFKHFTIITKHKYEVMKACFKSGIYLQGIMHDLSKYSIAEFIPSAKYFQGDSSPIDAEKIAKGYSFAWLHHRGRNPHHWEYWIDNLSKGGEPLKIPYKYCMEMICDWIGAGKVYNKENWDIKEPEMFFKHKLKTGQILLHKHTEQFITKTLESFSNIGYEALNKEITKHYYKNI